MSAFFWATHALFAQAAFDGDSLAKTLKPFLIDAMPATLHEKTDNWGHQAMVPVGIRWQGLKASVIKSPRNHGTWKKLIITSQELPRTLQLSISDFKNIDDEKQTFKVYFAFQMGVSYEQQNWENGVRLWSGSVRARAEVKINMECENTIRVEVGKDYLPDFMIRVRVVKANVFYDNLVVEHVNGIGGSAAKLIGQAVHECVKQWKPSIERDLLAKANAAVIKAADTKEIRVGFSSLRKSK